MSGYLRFDLADNCNLRCIMCQAYNNTPITAIKFTDFDDFVKGTKGQLNGWGTIQLGNVAEPLVNPRFDEFLRYIRSQTDTPIHIVTNGKLLGRYADAINEVGNCLVQISMDSIKEKIHEYIRFGSTFDKVIANMEKIDLSDNRVLLSFTLMNSNIEEYPEIVEFTKARGFMLAVFPMILRDEQGVIPLQLIKESLWFNRDGLDDWLRLYYGNDYEGVVIGCATDQSSHVDFSCDKHETDLVVDMRGNALLCGKKTIGNIYTSGLKNTWNSEQAKTFRAAVDLDQSPCMDCDYRKRCIHPSMSLLDNHFAEGIANFIPDAARESLSLTRVISDSEAMGVFANSLCETFGIFDITETPDGYEATRMRSEGKRDAPIKAKKRHELQKLMIDQVQSPYEVALLEKGFYGYNLISYMLKFWAVPQSFGVINITMQPDRERPGVLSADSIGDLKNLITSNTQLSAMK